MDQVYVSTHPLVLHKLALLRSELTEPKKFRELVREIAQLLFYEATQDLSLAPLTVQTPLAPADGHEVAERIGIMPILRAGLGMSEAVVDILPTVHVWHLGLYRDHETLEAVEYFFKAPESIDERLVIVVDPMLATGNSAIAAIDTLKSRGATNIRFLCLLAAPEGIKSFRAHHPDVPVYTASIDRQLNEKGYIVPGLGDAGDRMYGTK